MNCKELENGITIFHFEDKFIGTKVIVCLKQQSKTATKYLAGIRYYPNHQLLSVLDIQKEIIQQTENLNRKIKITDKFQISVERFLDNFNCGRIFITSFAPEARKKDWKYAIDCMKIIEKKCSLKFISQPDYDQFKYNIITDNLLDSIGFKVKHTPSAIGTCIIFTEVLKKIKETNEKHNIGIVGIGNLGSRIVRILQKTKKIFFPFMI